MMVSASVEALVTVAVHTAAWPGPAEHSSQVWHLLHSLLSLQFRILSVVISLLQLLALFGFLFCFQFPFLVTGGKKPHRQGQKQKALNSINLKYCKLLFENSSFPDTAPTHVLCIPLETASCGAGTTSHGPTLTICGVA